MLAALTVSPLRERLTRLKLSRCRVTAAGARAMGSVPANSYLGTGLALARWAILDRLDKLKSRVLLIAAENDFTPLAEKRELAQRLNADLVVVKGDPSKAIHDIANVEIVFKDGVGFDSKRLLDSIAGRYGQY